MSVEIFLRKRVARAGEIGLFLETTIYEEEWNSVAIGAECDVKLTVPVHEKYRKAFHALCGTLADAVELFGSSKEFAKEQLLMQCRHVTYHYDRLRDKTEIRAKTTSKLDADGWRRLLKRADYVIETEYLPGIPEGSLKDEIEKRIGFNHLEGAK
jgi:hypothetical protein